MRIAKPRVNLLYESAVKELKAAGVDITPDEYVWLYEAAKKAINGSGSECPAFIEIPVTIGDVTLWPMTIGAMLWWSRYAEEWYANDKTMQIIAMAYCMAHAKEPETILNLNSKAKADIALVAWQATTSSKCTLGQLSWAIDKVNGQFDYVDIHSENAVETLANSSADWGVIIAKLCGAYHMPARYFLWDLSQSAAIDMLTNAPSPFGYAKDTDAQASRYFGEFREVVAHIKRRALNKEPV